MILTKSFCYGSFKLSKTWFYPKRMILEIQMISLSHSAPLIGQEMKFLPMQTIGMQMDLEKSAAESAALHHPQHPKL